ncbi:hypothetical protein A2U01_0008924, partial [Trifolium medium]|nr:hypothetical protein [Trifolium medium]
MIAINHWYDKLHSDVHSYAMMTRTCYMEYDPMNSRGIVPGIYARCIGPVIGNTVFFQDIILNQIQVVVERNKSEIYFTHGWSRLRDFYIGSGAWLTLLFINPFVFHMKIRDITGIEITYPVKTPPCRLLEKTLTAADVASGTLLDNNPRTSCDICKVHRLVDDVIVKFGVTEASDNRTVYFKLSPCLGVRTTLHAPSTAGNRK